MTNEKLGEKVATNKTNIDNIIKTLDKFADKNSEFKKEIFEKLEGIDGRLQTIETTMIVKKEGKEISWKWLVFLTGLITFTLDHIGSIFTFLRR